MKTVLGIVHSHNTSRHFKTPPKINLPPCVEHWPALIRARAQYGSRITYASLLSEATRCYKVLIGIPNKCVLFSFPIPREILRLFFVK